MKPAKISDTSPIVTISGPGAMAAGLAASSILKRSSGIERDVEQQARQHRGDGRRALGVRIGQPGVQRRQPDLGAVAQHQEHEGDVEQLGRKAAALATSAVHTMASWPSPSTGRAAM